MKNVSVGGMSEAVYGLKTLERIKEEGLGNYTVLFCGPWKTENIKDLAAYCKSNKLRFVMDETYDRLHGQLKKAYAEMDLRDYEKIIEEAGDSFDGSLFMCEFGGMMFYWPANYVAGSHHLIPETTCAKTARDEMIRTLEELIASAKKSPAKRPLVCIEASGGIAKYLYEGGIDRVDLEVTYDRFTEFYYSATKGATIAYGKERFGVDMAMVWYGGNVHNKLWFKRWKTSLYHAFIRGADPIYAEHGLMDYKALGKNLDTGSVEVQRFRQSLGELAEFAAKHPRPSGFPEARIAVAYGNLDSFSMGQPYIWGQRVGNPIKSGSAEQSWELFETFYRRNSWEYSYASGDSDLSGNPPLGQVDVVPADSPAEVLSRYECLIFLGWNTMTPEIYSNLRKFTAGGGHLLCTLAHLSTNTRRDEPLSIINDGDLNDFFGVSIEGMDKQLEVGIKFKDNPSSGNYRFPLWSAVCDPKYYDGGFSCASLRIGSAELIAAASENFNDSWENMDKSPVITANRVGNGMAFLVNSLEYPGHYGLKRLYQDLLRHFSLAFQKDITVESSDSVRFAVYKENGMDIIYLLNTDPACTQNLFLSTGNSKAVSLSMKAGEMLVCYRTGNLLAIPENTSARISSLGIRNGRMKISFTGASCDSGNILCFVDGIRCDDNIEVVRKD